MSKYNFDLENRLVAFAVEVLRLANRLPQTFAGKHLAGQLIRSGTSPALNYGEAQGAESRADFKHKMRICLKELRETKINMRIIQDTPLLLPSEVAPVLKENGELIAIFTKSVETLERNAPPG